MQVLFIFFGKKSEEKWRGLVKVGEKRRFAPRKWHFVGINPVERGIFPLLERIGAILPYVQNCLWIFVFACGKLCGNCAKLRIYTGLSTRMAFDCLWETRRKLLFSVMRSHMLGGAIFQRQKKQFVISRVDFFEESAVCGRSHLRKKRRGS